MRDRDSDLWKPRNPITQRQIRRETLWQVIVPMAIAALVILALSIGAWFLPSAPASLWADVALIWMIMPACLVTFLFAAITFGGAWALGKAIKALPPFFYKAQNIARQVALKVEQISRKITGPVIKANTLGTSARTARRAARGSVDRIIERD